MAGFVLDAATVVSCPHGGVAQLTPRTSRVALGGMPPLVVDDTFTIVGCALALQPTPTPCTTVQWQAPATRVSVGGSFLLLSTSVGLCIGPPGGPASVTNFQTRVTAQ